MTEYVSFVQLPKGNYHQESDVLPAQVGPRVRHVALRPHHGDNAGDQPGSTKGVSIICYI